jgi:hypothetical protein
MQPLFCTCGQTVFCDNTLCGNCGRSLGFDPTRSVMHGLRPGPGQHFEDAQGVAYQLCANRRHYQVCNGVVPLEEQPGPDTLCNTCCLNRTIPVVDRSENLLRWQRLERAKRRMVTGLATLGLEVGATNNNIAGPMRFDFMEDKRSHPDVLEHFVSTGHKDGLITINLMEADEIQRVQQRELSGERYRTLLGHFRHEAGHYYYPQLVTTVNRFIELFGDPREDYEQALKTFYNAGPAADWSNNYISAYASSHPLEDWAECFAHYLHIHDTLETASISKLVPTDILSAPVLEQLEIWGDLVITLNEINRSLGVRDPYPFIINAVVGAKLAFVEQAVRGVAA